MHVVVMYALLLATRYMHSLVHVCIGSCMRCWWRRLIACSASEWGSVRRYLPKACGYMHTVSMLFLVDDACVAYGIYSLG